MMRRITLCLAFYLTATTCFSQTSGPPTQEHPKGTKEYYLQRSKAKKTKGWVFTTGGVVLLGVSYVLALAELANGLSSYGRDEPDGTGAGLAAVAGVVSIVGGTISFVSAGHNKRKARSLAVGFEQVPLHQQKAFMTKGVPTVGLKVSF